MRYRPESGASLESIGDRRQRDNELVDVVGLHHLLARESVAEPPAQDGIDEIHVEAFGIVVAARMHVDQLDGDIGVHRRRGHVEPGDNAADDLDIRSERRRLEHQHVGPRRQQRKRPPRTHQLRTLALVHRPVGDDRAHARPRMQVGGVDAVGHLHPFHERRHRGADAGNRMLGIVLPTQPRVGFMRRLR
jgi:hypothetical protein